MAGKKAEMRYKVLDACFKNRQRKYYIADLLEAVNQYMRECDYEEISERQLRNDINFMESDAGDNIVLEKIMDGHKMFYRYKDSNMSYFKRDLTPEEVNAVSETVQLLRQFKGLPTYEWVEETLLRLKVHFHLDDRVVGTVSFAQNPDLVGLEWFKPLFEAVVARKAVELDYHRFGKPMKKRLVHPYQMKQWNYRWYLVGYEPRQGDRLSLVVIPIDRVDGVTEARKVAFIPKSEEMDLDDYFYDIVGVSKLPEGQLVKIKLKAYYPAAHYMETKPIHPTQTELKDERGEDYKVLQLTVIPNEELVQALIVYGDQIEILEGEWIKKKLVERAKAILKRNHELNE